jgi:hypothetical protein
MTNRLLLALAAALTLTAALAAASYAKFEAITIANSSLGFTVANINNTNGSHPAATVAICRLELAEIRWTIDGSAPTTTAGILWEIGDAYTFTGNDTLNQFRAIRTGATSGQLDCTYSGSF